MATRESYAIVLREAGHPNAEPICRAFRTFQHLTDADAVRLAANAQGILMRHLGMDEARALHRALLTEGVNAVMVKEEDLRLLPASQLLHQIELTHDALVIYDLMGRTSAVAWGEIQLVAAGAVPHVEVSSSQTPPRRLGLHPVFGIWPKQSTAPRSRLETERHYILNLVVGPARYEIQAHQFPFKYVLDQPAASTMEKFVWLVRELTRRASRALLNRAAQDVRDGVTLVRGYPSRQLLMDEMIWLLWHRAHGPQPG